MAARRPARDRLAGWLRRVSARVAHLAATLERPAPDPVAPDGPPEHWIRMVRERAPGLLEGRGIRFGTPAPAPAGPLPPAPAVMPAHEPPRRTAGGWPALPEESRGDTSPADGPARIGPGRHDGLDGDVPRPPRSEPSPPADPASAGSAPRRRRVGPGPGSGLVTDPEPAGPLSRRPSAVDRPKKHAPERGSRLPRVLAGLVPVRPRQPREPRETRPVGTAGFPSAATGVGADSSIPAPAVDVAPARRPPWPVDAPHRRTTARLPETAGLGHPAAPRPELRSDLVPAPEGDRSRADPPPVFPDPPTADGEDARWPPLPDGPWPWVARRPGDRWPALPDDRSLWVPPPSVFTAAHVRRLDDEQTGA